MRIFSQKTARENKIIIFKALDFKKWRFVDVYSIFVKCLFQSLSVRTFLSILFLASAVTFGAYVYAQSTPREYDIDTLIVFPDNISSDSWNNVETLNEQNLKQESLYQQFTIQNSAYLYVSDSAKDLDQSEKINAQSKEASDSEGVLQESSDLQSPVETEILPNDDGGTTTDIQLDTVVPTEAIENEETVPNQSVVETQSTLESVEEIVPPEVSSESPTVMRKVKDAFSMVFTNVLETFSATGEGTASPDMLAETIENNIEPIEITNEEPTDLVPSLDLETLNEETVPDASTGSSTPKDDPVPLVEGEATSSQEIIGENEAAVKTQPKDQNNIKTSSVSGAYSIILDDFALPLEDSIEITGGQFRISFAAKTKSFQTHGSHVLNINYSFDGGKSWQSSGSVDIDDEVSNSINGGFFLFALPVISDIHQLDSFMVEINYVGDPQELDGVYLDSAWLELFIAKQKVENNETIPFVLPESGFDQETPYGDELELPDGSKVKFNFTDDNSGETLIIKSDRREYTGLTETVAYFNVTNTSNDTDAFTLETHFATGTGGQLLSLEEWNQNKPHEVVIPEYRPHLYHCAAGWEEYQGSQIESFSDFKLLVSTSTHDISDISEEQFSTETPISIVDPKEVVVPIGVPPQVEVDATTTSSSSIPKPVGTEDSGATLPSATGTNDLIAATVTESLGAATTSDLAVQSAVDATTSDNETDDSGLQYVCGETNVIRTCDVLDGDNTSCLIKNKKVAEHEFEQYRPGWEQSGVASGTPPDRRGIFKKFTDFLGFGVDRKTIPEKFEETYHSPDTFTIKPGETKFFKMRIAFAPHTKGEFWIEAIGNSNLYGLLDPFWSSQWNYRLPIVLDNTNGTTDLTEQQVYLQLENATSSFWSNVNEDGSDIRFVQETVGSDDGTWYDTSWQRRLPIVIQSSQVDADLTDFPIYVDMSTLGSDFFNLVQNDGDDIRITEGDGVTEVPLELVSISTGAQTGQLYFRATNVYSATDTTFYLYYNNGSASGYAASDPYGSENVWTNNFEAVLHFEEDPGGSAPQMTDSTGNGHDASVDLMDSSNQVTGQFGYGVDADGSTESVIAPGFTNLGASNQPYAIGIWFNADTGETDGNIVGMSVQNPPNGWRLPPLALNADKLDAISWPGQSTAAGVTSITQGSWQQGYTTWSASAGLDGYLDGALEDNNTQGTYSASGGSNYLHLAGDVAGGAGDEGHFNGKIDELRVYNDTVQAEWISTEYNNQNAPTTFYATSSIESFVPTSHSELDYWLQHFSTTSSEADVWVQVDSIPAGATTTIYLYYGNSGATSMSDEYAPFTYSTTTDVYYVVDDASTGPIEVYSLIDNNVVQLDNNTPVSLDAGETTSLTGYSGSSVIRAVGPISATIDDTSDTIVPISFASTTQAIATNRNTSRFYIYSPFASTSVQTYIGNSGTPTDNFSLGTSSVATSNTDASGSSGVVIESSEPILAYHLEASGRDSAVLYPPTRDDLFGIDSNNLQITSLVASPDPTVYCSGGTTASVTGITRGEAQGVNNCTQGGDGTGDAVRFSGALYPIAAIQQADGDGNETSVFLPQYEFGTEYYLSTDSAYVAVVCSPRFPDVDLEMQLNDGTLIESGTCTPSGSLPGKAYFVNGGNGDTLAFSAGSKVISTNGVPFYAVYEDDEEDNDETNVWGSVQGRKFLHSDLSATFGAQEINNDAQYEQLSYLWYQNGNTLTPTSTWPLDSEGTYANEGEALTGQGAVNLNDVLRLRMSLMANVATGTVASLASFRLQYVEAATDQCSSVADTDWLYVGDIGSTTAAFAGYNNSSLNDGAELSSTTLASSTVFATYEEANASANIPNEIGIGEAAEWDWVIESVNAGTNSNYCFRMVRSSGEALSIYTSYPQLETSGPPLQPTLSVYFNNEKTTELNSVLEFIATDIASDDLHYQVQIDDDVNFGSLAVNRNSETHFTEFENINDGSDKSPFDSGVPIRFTSPTTLSPTTTYWWRVRAWDPTGSNTYSEWSEPSSFTTDGSVAVSEWYQTTGDQFSTNNLTSLSTSTGAVAVSGSSGTMVGTAVDFDDATVGNAWGEFAWNDTETSGTILYQVEFLNGSTWMLIPDSDLPNNSTGTGTSPISLLSLDTDTYNQIRLVANFSGTTLSVQDWSVKWGLRVDTPTLGDPFDNEKIATVTPTLTFTTTDPQSQDLEYEVSWSTDNTFTTGTTTVNSTTSPGFSNVTTPLDEGPFNSGDTVSYKLTGAQSLTDGLTYWWRVRAKDPGGGDAWSPWSDPDVFTVDTAVVVSTWFQTTAEQFQQGTLDGLIASTSDSVLMNDQVGEYGKTIITNGTWTEVDTQLSYNDPVVVASGRYSPTGDTQRSVRVRNKTATSFEILADNFDSSVTGTTTVDYLVMESGVWTIDDGAGGTQVIAGTEANVSDVQANTYAGSGYGQDVIFSPAFSSPPAVIATVSTENDSTWVLAHLNDGNTRNNPPTASGMGLYLGRGFESAVHDPEDIDYIAFETGHGVNNGAEFDADFSADVHDEPPVTAEPFNSAFSPSAPEVVIVMQAAEQGGNGAFALLYAATPPTTANYYPAIDEDGTGADRNHATEPVLTLAFENSSGILLRQNTGSLTGSIYSEPVYFLDGTGPKFEQVSWTDNEPGLSTALYQVEYLTGTSTWALVPDVAISGNSTGTTTSPIDLTGLNVATYGTLRLVSNFTCQSGNCPSLDDWTVEWSEGVTMSGTLKAYDRTTNVNSGTVRVAVNGVLLGSTGSVSSGTWSVNNVTAFNGDVITVFVDGANEANEAVGVFVYDGTGDMTGVDLYEGHLSLSADETGTTTNALLASYDNSVSGDEDIFFDVDGANDLSVCAITGCGTANLYIGSGNIYIPDTVGSGNVSTHDLVNDGRVELDANTIRVSGSWDNNATLYPDTSTIIFTATSSIETLDDTDNILDFNNLTFGETSGTATWQTADPLDVNGNLKVTYGTLSRASSTITAAKNITTAANGYWSGISTTTFDGTASAQWSDSNLTTQNIGYVVVDGSVKVVTIQSNVRASRLTIGANDTLDAGGAYTISVNGNFKNNNTFTPRTSTVNITATNTPVYITSGGSSFNNLTFSGAGAASSFTNTTVTVLGTLTIATGTVTLPSTRMSIGASFLNTGGIFVHNNAEVRFTGSGSRTVTASTTDLFNAFYDLSFTGSANWTFTDTNATTSHNMSISGGAVTFPSGTLTVGGDFGVSGSGSFAHNNGEVIFLITDSDTITTNGSSFNDTRFVSGSVSGSWYDLSWGYRLPIVIDASQVTDDMTNFPVYVDLADLGSQFFSNINTDGGDIRITESDGTTEVPRELVSASSTTETGELYFLATNLSSTTNSTFYIYYGNTGANDYATSDPYGAENVWTNGFEGVMHLEEDPGGSAPQMIDSTGNSHVGTVFSMDSSNQLTGQFGYAIDHDGGTADRVRGDGYSNLGTVNTAYSISTWFNADSGETDGALVHVSSADTGGGWCLPMLSIASGAVRAISWVGSQVTAQGTTPIVQGDWSQAYTTWDASNGLEVYLNGALEDQASQATFSASGGSNYIHTGFDPPGCAGDNGGFNGKIDEVRIYNVRKPVEWIETEYNNMASSTDFYTVGSLGLSPSRIFSDSAATVLGDIIIDSGTVTFPTGVLTVGGSFDNNDTFDNSDGTVTFNSSSGSETIAPGNSEFSTVIFNGAGGNWTITESATATTAFTLTAANDFTLQSGLVLAIPGVFTNHADGASTTWTGSALWLSSDTDYAINSKTDNGDSYATVVTTDDTDISLWNSDATSFTTLASSSVYSQDHSGNDGDLYIYGDYERTSGTEYWSYATDFDGMALGAGSRQVDVRPENGASITVNGAQLDITGVAGASTTVDAQSGNFALVAVTATVDASYFEMTGTDINGFNLSSSSVVTTFDNTLFTIGAGVAAVTVDASTVDANPASQFFNTNFVTGGGSVNVTLSGSPSSYWWFRDGAGDRYGEAYDNGDGNPGSIRWDDSAYVIAVSGVIYADDGATPLGGPTCDGVTNNIRIVVDGGTYASSTSCNGINGSYSFPTVSYAGDPSILVYLDTNGGTHGSVITKTPTADITDLNVYANRVMTRHEDATPLTIADMTPYDGDDDSDIQFVAATGSPDTLIVNPENELTIASSTTFIPGGSVTLQSGGSGALYDGTLHVDNSATLTASGTESYSIGGSIFVDPNANLTTASSTFVMTATTTGKTITASSTLTFNELQFNGIGGGWNLNTDLSILGDVDVATGTLTGTGSMTLSYGSISGDGLVSLGGGTVTIARSSTLGGSQGWTFNNLTLGSGSVVGTTTPASTATTTVNGALTIATAHFLDAGASQWSLGGTGSVFVENGTFLEDTSTVRYSGGTASNVLSTTYYNLDLNGSAGTPTYTATGLGVSVLNNFTVGGESTSTATFTTNDPALAVSGDVYIRDNGTLIGSNSASFTVAGNWSNSGVYTSSGGIVIFNATNPVSISAGSSSFSGVTINGAGDFTVTEHATATGAFNITNAGSFTLQNGEVLAVGGSYINNLGGGVTTWAGSTLFLYGGGNYAVNASTTSDTYDTLRIADDTHIRLWNSGASTIDVSSLGSLYSQDHNNLDGDLYIFGAYPGNGATDYWNYARDFDGTSLSGGSRRQANIYLASGASIAYTTGGLQVLGTSTASTTLQNQGSGSYGLRVGGVASTSMSYYTVRDIDSSGITFSGTPHITTLSRGDIEVSQAAGSGMTVGGTVIDQNPAKNFTQNRFATTSILASAFNVTATGTSISSWRFTNHIGNISGEDFDSDPAGDPGYVVWDDSAAVITIAGTVYSDEGTATSTVCDGSTQNIRLLVAGLTSYTASCDASSGAYTIPGVSYSPNDTLTVYIDGETQQAATVSIDPVSSIGNMHLYENRVIVRHEGTDPITIADMSVWDSSDDPDIPFTAIDGSPDTLTLPSDTKLIVWNGKEFAPGGNVTLSGGGGGAAYDGTLELYPNSSWTSGSGESHSVGGSIIADSGASVDANTSSFTFTTNGSGRTFDVNGDSLYDATFSGSGSWTVSDSDLTVLNNLLISSGDVTLPTGTTTVGGSFDNTGGTFDANAGVLLFTATAGGQTIEAGGSTMATVIFRGIGGAWTFTDTNATATNLFKVATGSVTLPSGILTVDSDFIINDTVSHNNGTVRLTSSSLNTDITLSGNDLYSLVLDGTSIFTLSDEDAALLGDLLIDSGTFISASGTLSIAGSFDATNGVYTHSSGTVLFNSSDTGETVNPGSNLFYNVNFSSASGGWTLTSATTTQNFSLTAANSFTLASGDSLAVGNTFTNTVGGAATTWTGTTIRLLSATNYTVNTRSTGGDQYDTVYIAPNTDIRMWDSSATTLLIASTSSLYSQDDSGVSGYLSIYGDYHRTTGTDYWSYATDFDGTALGGSSRAVRVRIEDGATTTLESSGSLQIVGTANATTTIGNQGSGTFSMFVTGGTLNAQYYAFRNLATNGIVFTGTPTVTSLSNGDLELAENGGILIKVSTSTIDANASKIISGIRLTATTSITGSNISLTGGTTSNAWTFTGHSGDLDGELYDIDGGTDCGSLRWDDSTCLLTQQTHYRWRNDDGTEGAPDSEWYNPSWGKRQRIRIDNNDASTYSNVAVKLDVTYDADMQTDFGDLRFTDSTGLVTIPYWIESYSASTDATVWVQVSSLPANDTAVVYMYYDDVAATTTGSSTQVFTIADDFEGGDISEYSGDTTLFAVDGTYAFSGTYGLDATGHENSKATDGISRSLVVSQGQIIRYNQYVNTASGGSDEVCTLFGIQGAVTANNNYGVCIELFGVDRISLVRDAQNTETSAAEILASSTASYSTGWYTVEVDWKTNNDIDLTLYNSSGGVVATTSANDGTYTTGTIGFTFWGQHGGWDDYTSRPRVDTEPTVYFGAEQTDGGASWASAIDTTGTSFEIGDTARLRVSLENSGLDITSQLFQLEYAAKGAALNCSSVSYASYAEVPNQGSCGSSPICMQTSAQVNDSDPTTDHLTGVSGTFVAGSVIESPSNQTGSTDLGQNKYTELEYVITPTVNASDTYCFRVTNDGTDLDSYTSVPELQLAFTPNVTSASLNNGLDITLFQGGTTTIYATGTVTDLNGYADLVAATSTIFRSGVGESCSADVNNCYISSAPQCTFLNCAGNSCDIECTADIYYFAEPTDLGSTYAGETWRALLTVSDSAGYVATATAPSVDLMTLRALSVDSSIDYGTLAVSSNTGSYNATTTVQNIGNESIDVSLEGTDLTDGGSSDIPVSEQIFATSSFNYSSCVFCTSLSSSTLNYELDLTKPTSTAPSVIDQIYWGINIPFGIAGTPHTGTNTFTAIGD